MPISIIDSSGVERFLGNNPAPLRLKWGVYGDAGTGTPPLIPRDEWPDYIKALQAGRTGVQALDDMDAPPVADQNGRGQCNASATTTLVESLRSLQGLSYVQLSAGDLYDRINGGVDNGSLLEDAMAVMMAQGVGTMASAPYLWSSGMPVASAEERARFKMLEVWVCPTFDHLMSATLAGFSGVSGIFWYDNYTPDAAGWLPERPAGNHGGHAIFKGVAADFRGSPGNYRYALGHQNSWTTRWGRKGRMYIPEAAYQGDVGGWWIGRQVTTEVGDIPAPKS